MPSTPLPVVLATLALRRRLKQLADMLVPPEIAMLDLGEGVGGVQIAATIAELGIADVLAGGPMTAPQIAVRIDCDRGDHASPAARRGRLRSLHDGPPNGSGEADPNRSGVAQRPSCFAAGLDAL